MWVKINITGLKIGSIKSIVGLFNSGTKEESLLKYSFFIPCLVISKSFSKLHKLQIITCLLVELYVILYLLFI